MGVGLAGCGADARQRCGRYENTEKRKAMVGEKGILYMGMGVSGGEEGARNGALSPTSQQHAHLATCLPDCRSVDLTLAFTERACQTTFMGLAAQPNEASVSHWAQQSMLSLRVLLRRACHDARRQSGGLQAHPVHR